MAITALGLAGAQAGLSMINSFLGHQQDSADIDKQHKYNKELAEYNWQKSLEQWNRENAYNSPQAYMERLAAAGLNPNIAIGSNVGTSSAASPQFHQEGADQSRRPIQVGAIDAATLGLMDAKRENINADTNKKNKDATLTAARTVNEKLTKNLIVRRSEYQGLVNKLKQHTMDASIESVAARLSLLQGMQNIQSEQYNLLKQRVIQQEFQNTLNDMQREKLSRQIDVLVNTADLQEFEKNLRSMGVTSGDSVIIRMLVQGLAQFGVTLDDIKSVADSANKGVEASQQLPKLR